MALDIVAIDIAIEIVIDVIVTDLFPHIVAKTNDTTTTRGILTIDEAIAIIVDFERFETQIRGHFEKRIEGAHSAVPQYPVLKTGILRIYIVAGMNE